MSVICEITKRVGGCQLWLVHNLSVMWKLEADFIIIICLCTN